MVFFLFGFGFVLGFCFVLVVWLVGGFVWLFGFLFCGFVWFVFWRGLGEGAMEKTNYNSRDK